MNDKQALLERIKKLPADKQALLFRQLEHAAENEKIEPIDKSVQTPSSYAQLGLWNIYETEGPNDKYNMPSAYQLSNKINLDALKKSFKTVVRRHESLRTYFTKTNNELYQVLIDIDNFDMPIVDFTSLSESEKKQKVFVHIENNGKHVFKLEKGPLFIVSILKLVEDFHILLMNAHHIIFDGWSKGILLKEVFNCYRHYSELDTRNHEISTLDLPSLPIQYRDFSYWERQQKHIDRQIDYWVDKLKDAPHLLTIGDKARVNRSSGAGFAVPIRLNHRLSQSLLDIGRRQGASAFMTMLATFSILLARYARQAEILIGTPIDNRNRQELRNLIGYFLNTTVLRVKINEADCFFDIIKSVKAVCLDAYANQDAPFNRVVEAVNPVRSLAISPLFQAMFVFQVAGASELKLPNVVIQQIDNEKIDIQQLEKLEFSHLESYSDDRFVEFESHSKYDLYLTFIEEGGDKGLAGWLTYNSDLFSQRFIRNFLMNYVQLLEKLALHPDKPLYTLPFLSKSDRDIVLHEKSPLDVPVVTIAQLFEKQVNLYPQANALLYGNETLSYSELNERANRIAHYWLELGVKTGDIVALELPRGAEMIICMLAAFKLGAAYLPLDPSLPAARIGQYLNSAKPVLVITRSEYQTIFEDWSAILFVIDQCETQILRQSSHNLNIAADAGLIAYVLYTSGSTGQPKGVMATHAATLNRLQWMWQTHPFQQGEILCHKTTCSFVDSIAEIWSPLLQGFPLLIAPQETVLDLYAFIQLLETRAVSRLTLVPSLLLAMLDHYPELGETLPSLKIVISSGETLTSDLAKRFYAAFPEGLLINLYGSTEVAADATYYPVPRTGLEEDVPIGLPIDNCRVYVLDPYLNLCPVGVVGELYVGGIPVAPGYYSDAILNTQKFIPDPFAGDGSRMFRTFDNARFRYDGQLQYLGRKDNQVKIRGFRLNLDEIRQTLMQNAEVKDAIAMSYQKASGDIVLVAYVVPEDESAYRLKAESLRAYLRTRLPDYMVPGHYTILEHFPLLENGKINMRQLPEPDFTAHADGQYQAPTTETEVQLAEIWKTVLQLPKISRNDNFFDLGGHSIAATKVAVMIRETFQLEVQVQDIFNLLTIEELARHIDNLLNIRNLLQPAPGISEEGAQNEKDRVAEVYEF